LLAVLTAAACRRGDADPPDKVMHLERWDGAGVPVLGDIDITVRGFDPAGDLAKATGTVEVVCDPCVIEESRLQASAPSRSQAGSWAAGQSIGLPRIDLGMVRGQLRVNGGRAEIEGHAAGGPGLEIAMNGTISFAPSVADSQTDIQLVLRPGPEIETENPRLRNILLILGPADASGAITIHMTGPLGRMRQVSRR
jgi:type II secretion system protein N